jgi:hypothetical protein
MGMVGDNGSEMTATDALGINGTGMGRFFAEMAAGVGGVLGHNGSDGVLDDGTSGVGMGMDSGGVVYSSRAEQVASSVVICVTSAVTMFAQCVLITAIWRTRSLHETYFYVLATYCVTDLITISLYSTHYTVQLVYGYPPFATLHWKVRRSGWG